MRQVPALFELCFHSTNYLYFENPRPSVEVIEKCKSKLTHLSLVLKTAGGVAKLFFSETKAKPCGNWKPSGLGQPQLAEPAGPEEEPLETVGQTHSLLYRT